MKDFNYYDGRDLMDKYPEYPSKPIRPKESKPNELRQYADALEQYDKDKQEYENQVKPLRDEASERYDEFKRDLFDEYGVTDNPKRDKCYAIAYEYGHSSGCGEIHSYFCNIVELIQ